MLSIVEKVLFLRSVNLFSSIPGEFLAHIARIATEEAFTMGEEVIKEGEMGDSLYLINEGTVKVHKGANELAKLGPGQCFGEMAILDNEPRSASVTAVSDVLLMKISSDDFYEIMDQRPEIAREIIKVLNRRLREAIKTR